MRIGNYARSDAGPVIAEAERTATVYRNNVDSTRSHLNCDLAIEYGDRVSSESPTEKLDRMIKDTPHAKRKDLRVLSTVIIDPPPKFLAEHPDQTDEFFDAAYSYFRTKFGPENMIYATVHYDETTPHMQLGFCPIVEDKKHPDKQKICVTECITHEYTTRMHIDVSKAISKNLGYEVEMLTGATANGALTIERLKAQTLANENEKLNEELATKTKALTDMSDALSSIGTKKIEPIKESRRKGERTYTINDSDQIQIALDNVEAAQQVIPAIERINEANDNQLSRAIKRARDSEQRKLISQRGGTIHQLNDEILTLETEITGMASTITAYENITGISRNDIATIDKQITQTEKESIRLMIQNIVQQVRQRMQREREQKEHRQPRKRNQSHER